MKILKTTALLILGILVIAFGHSQTHAQENGDSILLAASKCDVSTVKRWIASGSEVDTTDEHGNTIFKYAVEVNCTELVDYLLSLSANVNAKAKHGGGTPLMIASSRGYVALVRKLLAAGADVNAKDEAGWTALKQAVVSHQNDVLKVLIETGADINARDNDGEPLLMTAATVNNIDVVKLLLASGAEVDAENKGGWTAFGYAASSHRPEVLKLLIAAGANVNVRDKQGKTPLIWAASYGNVEGVKELLLLGAEVNVVDKHGKSALMYASEAEEYSKEVTALLRAAGASDRTARKP